MDDVVYFPAAEVLTLPVVGLLTTESCFRHCLQLKAALPKYMPFPRKPTSDDWSVVVQSSGSLASVWDNTEGPCWP